MGLQLFIKIDLWWVLVLICNYISSSGIDLSIWLFKKYYFLPSSVESNLVPFRFELPLTFTWNIELLLIMLLLILLFARLLSS